MKRLNVLIQNGNNHTIAELQLSMIYGVELLSDTIEGLTLISGYFTGEERAGLIEWLTRTIKGLGDGTVGFSLYQVGGRSITLSSSTTRKKR